MYNDAEKKAYERDKNLTCDQPGMFAHTVHVVHQDGSTVFLMHAHVEKDGPYYMVFSEHVGWLVFHEEDIDHIREYDPIYECNEEDDDATDEDGQTD